MTFDKPSSPVTPYYNPFADEQHSTTAVNVAHSTTNHRPAIRRRTSSSDSFTSSSSGLSVFGNGHTTHSKHLRIRTDGNANGHHPLRSADLSSTLREGAGITRPQLTRALNIPPLVDAPTVPGADMMVEEPPANEKVVLVHEVSSKDSLAGIALKYGITLADLRRANSLWSSDSIHLRKVLYIPIDKTSRAKALAPPPLLISTEDDQPPPASPTPIETAAIRRVPASQLSFFPPHSASARTQPENSPADLPQTQPKPTRHARYATSPHIPGAAGSPSSSLSSILAALPIQPSTRDTIMARLSYESTSSSYSDREEGHELDDVRRGTSLDSIFHPSLSDATPRPKAKIPPADSESGFTRSHARTSSASNAYPGNGAAQYRRAGPPRTVQLEPSPTMQLPSAVGTLRRKAQRAVNGSGEGNGAFDLLGFANGEGQGETVDWDP
ncbi:Peptidoglycan-binding domain-containing protein 1 [Mycena chlorophos]|uniref:Peptidoglycan-binding domain-containing protein 1 n=1 Tax=Mycena chlorophos TaxID=658473 RepID=A0A8H6W5R1_MYCCL|nr:Peptidoglycan-binding domain-containing protein 1 [Mycena chlorophos]